MSNKYRYCIFSNLNFFFYNNRRIMAELNQFEPQSQSHLNGLKSKQSINLCINQSQDNVLHKNQFANLSLDVKNVQILNRKNSQSINQKNKNNSLCEDLKKIRANIKKTRASIQSKKAQLQKINSMIDQKVMKSIWRQNEISYSSPICIKDIFQDTWIKSSNEKIKKIFNELSQLRVKISKKRQNINKIMKENQNPFNNYNLLQAQIIENKLQQKCSLINHLNEQKRMLQSETQGLAQVQHQQMRFENQSELLKKELNMIYKAIKILKEDNYQVDRKDIRVTENIKYLQELIQLKNTEDMKYIQELEQQKNSPKENKRNSKQIEIEMKSIFEQYCVLVNFKQQIEKQKKQLFKQFNQEFETIQTIKNKGLKQIRQIDAYFLQHQLEKKRNNSKNNRKTTKEQPKPKKILSRTKPNFTDTSQLQAQNIQIKTHNKSTIDIGFITQDKQSIISTDQFLGDQLQLTKLTIVADDNYIYGVSAEYINHQNQIIKGYNSISKIKPKEARTLELTLTPNIQFLTKLSFAMSKEQIISYLAFQTSEKHELQWKSQRPLLKTTNTIISAYSGIILKSQLKAQVDNGGPNVYCLVGFGFKINQK